MADKELAGKVALVTGASRNIGRAIALQLAAGGAAVGVNARNAKEDADKVVQEVKQAGGQAETFMADIVDPKAVNAMVEGVVKKFGRLDFLILNASVRKETAFMDMSFEEWKSLLSITLDGSFHCVKASLPHMIKAGGGAIVTLRRAGPDEHAPRGRSLGASRRLRGSDGTARGTRRDRHAHPLPVRARRTDGERPADLRGWRATAILGMRAEG